jgi:putative transposase
MQPGTFLKLVDGRPLDDELGATKSALVAERDGWNLHAGVHLAASDDLGREKLLRYGARPAFALDRLRRLPDRRIAYRVKYARRRSKFRVMTPLEFLARLSALIPPPRFPLVRFHGVLGPRSSWRKHVVPRPPFAQAPCAPAKPETARRAEDERRPHAHRPPPATDSKAPTPRDTLPSNRADDLPAHDEHRIRLPPPAPQTFGAPDAPAASDTDGLPDAELLTPNVLSVSHWTRIERGALYAATRRIPWRELLRRTFDVDVERCSACGERLRILGAVIAPWPAREILRRLGLPTSAPTVVRARDPTDLLAVDPFADGSA